MRMAQADRAVGVKYAEMRQNPVGDDNVLDGAFAHGFPGNCGDKFMLAGS